MSAVSGRTAAAPWCCPGGRPRGGVRKRGAPDQPDTGRESHCPSDARWYRYSQSVWRPPLGAGCQQIRPVRLRSVGGGAAMVLRRSDAKGYPASRGLHSVRHFCSAPRPLGRVIAHARVQCNRWMSPCVAASLASARTLHGRDYPRNTPGVFRALDREMSSQNGRQTTHTP